MTRVWCRVSVQVLQDQCYHQLLHGIEEVEEDILDGRILNLEAGEEGKVLRRGTRSVFLTFLFQDSSQDLPNDQTRPQHIQDEAEVRSLRNQV